MQAAHACLAGGRRFTPPEAGHLVLLAVDSAGEILAAAALAEGAGLRCAIFADPDETPAVTALCTEPVSGEARRVFRRYALWAAPTEDAGAQRGGRGPPNCGPCFYGTTNRLIA